MFYEKMKFIPSIPEIQYLLNSFELCVGPALDRLKSENIAFRSEVLLS